MKKRCLKCRGTGAKLFYDKQRFAMIVDGTKCPECNGTGNYWEEEFEDEIIKTADKLHFKNYKLYLYIFEKYFGLSKVKIKARKGCIQIERIG